MTRTTSRSGVLAACVACMLSGLPWFGVTPVAAQGQPRGAGRVPPAGPHVAGPQGEPRTAQPRTGQRPAPPRAEAPPPRTHAPVPPRVAPPVPTVRGQVVFIGGYFYDPFYGPYPWWPRHAYPYWYFPAFDHRASVHIDATPKQAAVYVDGFYAGVVDDFNGVFQALPLPPGGHRLTLYLEGYRTMEFNLYLRAGSTFKLVHALETLPAGEHSVRPVVAPPVPEPPSGTFIPPRRSPPVTGPPRAPGGEQVAYADGFGTMDLKVQPTTAKVTIDGERWLSSEEGHYVIALPVGPHRVEILVEGAKPFSTDIDVREGDVVPLNVLLGKGAR